MKTTRTLKRGMTILMGLVALCLAAGTAGAQTYKGEFNLADPVKWDQANLPAGEYTLTIDSTASGQSFGILRSESAHVAVMVVPQLTTEQESGGESVLSIQRVGDQAVVRSMYISELGRLFDFPVPREARKNVEQVANSVQRVKVGQVGK